MTIKIIHKNTQTTILNQISSSHNNKSRKKKYLIQITHHLIQKKLMTYVTIKIIHKNNQTTIIQNIIVNFVKIKTIIMETII